MESGNLTNEWLNDHRSGFFHQCAVGFASLYPELTRIFQGKGAGPSGGLDSMAAAERESRIQSPGL